MAIESKNILNTDTILLEVPAGKKYAITTLIVCNYASSTATQNDSSFDMHLIKGTSGTKNNTNKALNNLLMPAQETFTFSLERIILEGGDKVVLVSPDADKLSATISYLEV